MDSRIASLKGCPHWIAYTWGFTAVEEKERVDHSEAGKAQKWAIV